MADRSRAPRNPLVRAKAPLSAGTRLSVSKEALVSAWFSLAERRLLVDHGSGIIVAWECEPPTSMLGASMCPELVKPRWLVAHRGGLFFG